MMNSGAYSTVRKKPGYAGYYHDGNLGIILEIDDIYSEEEAAGFFSEVARRIKALPPQSLSDFDRQIVESAAVHNLPIGFSLAGCLLKDEVLYLKTINEGQVFLKRGKILQRIIAGDNSASGLIKEKDIVILLTEYFAQISADLKKIPADSWHTAAAASSKAVSVLSTKDNMGTVVLFLDFHEGAVDQIAESGEIAKKGRGGLVLAIKERFRALNNRPGFDKKRRFTFLFIAAVAAVLLWSIGSGYNRKMDKAYKDNIRQAGEQIELQLREAADIAFLNREQANEKITAAKTQLGELAKNLPADKYDGELAAIKSKIDAGEKNILKKEEANSEEYYDLAMENKEAKGDKLYRWEDNAAILDSGRGVVYVLSLAKKSLQQRTDPSLKKAKLVAIYNNIVYYFLEGKGIFMIDADSNVKKMIDNDKEWNNVSAVAFYNGNLYLLDSGRDEILKYLGSESAFGGKSSYFQTGESIDLQNASTLAIDSSVYVGIGDRVIKYTSGARQSFKSDFPREAVMIERIIAAPDLDNVYVWDKAGSSLFVFNKQGEYQKEIFSRVFKEGDDIAVYQDYAYVIKGAKIFRVNTN